MTLRSDSRPYARASETERTKASRSVIRHGSAESAFDGATCFALYLRLNAAVREPLEALALLFGCPTCSAAPGEPCGGTDVPDLVHRIDGAVDVTLGDDLGELLAACRRGERVAHPFAVVALHDAPHAARLEEAARARDEWRAVFSPDGNPARRVWNRAAAAQMPRTALCRAFTARGDLR